jgi:hypothetical protein
MAQQGTAGQQMQNLRQRRTHSGAFACRKDDNT